MVGNKFEKILGWERQGELDSLNQSFYETIVGADFATGLVCVLVGVRMRSVLNVVAS